MITIRSSKLISEPTLIGFEATLKTTHAVYEMSSTGSGIDAAALVGGGLYGHIAWPRSLFRLGVNLVLEQQMFLASDCPDVALSWQFHGKTIPTQLIIKPHFAGCTPRGYRDIGFRREPEGTGGRLSWLPHVLGPKIIADTNGRYYDEPSRSLEDSAPDCGESASLTAPGSFVFQLTDRPSVIIFSNEGSAGTQRNQMIGAFLAGLMQRSEVSNSHVTTREPRTPHTVSLSRAA
jgi:hypothetical protein